MRKTKKTILLLIIVAGIAGVVFGCAQIKQFIDASDENQAIVTTEVSHKIYWINRDETRLLQVPKEFSATNVEDIISECLADLTETPSDNIYRSILSSKVYVKNFTYDSSNKQVTLYFKEEYGQQSKAAEVLTRAAIVKTLTQFSDDIQYVSFCIGDTPLNGADGNPMLMRGKDFVLDISGNQEYVREDYVTLYFANESRKKLKVEDVIVKYLSKINLETAVVNSLISGPIHDELVSALPENTKVNKVSVKEGICYVDLSKEFVQRVDEQSFALNVYSVVNTLTQLSGISRVQFMIDGEIFTDSIDGIKIDGLIEKDMSLVEKPERTQTGLEGETQLPIDVEQKIKDKEAAES